MTITFSTRIGPGFFTHPTFESFRFPAGDHHVKVVNENDGKGHLTEIATVKGADANDLAQLGMWADAAKQRGATTIAVIPYLPGARQDRGLPFGARVYAGILNSFELDQVIAFDPHSPVIEGLVNNLTVVDSASVVRRWVVGRADRDSVAQRYTGIIAPDAGGVKRASAAAKLTHLPVYLAQKHRDEATGKLSGFSCEDLPADGKFLVVDDICDGGGTFMGLAKATGLRRDQLGLFVSHGVFSGRAAQLTEHFEDIWTTDSFADDPRPESDRPSAFHIINIGQYLNGAIK